MKVFRWIPFLLLPVLAGCSPHPASGTWVNDAEEGFTRLEVTFEGRANLFTAGEEEAGRHCFWSAKGSDTVAVSCRPAADPDAEEHYQLRVERDGTATLIRDGDAVARFSRKPQ